MEVYLELSQWVGWPAIVALLLIFSGAAGWMLNQRLEVWKEKYADLERDYSRYKSAAATSQSYLEIDYGIEIVSPKDNAIVGETVEVVGTYKIKPPPETLRLFTIHPEKTVYGERIWPQEPVKEFSAKNNRYVWRAKVNVSGFPQEGGRIIVAVVGQSAIVLWNFYYKVGPQIGWWDIEGWPDDAKICDEVFVKRR